MQLLVNQSTNSSVCGKQVVSSDFMDEQVGLSILWVHTAQGHYFVGSGEILLKLNSLFITRQCFRFCQLENIMAKL